MQAMRYKEFTWPNNPARYTLSCERLTAVHKMPMGSYCVQDLGRSRTVLRGAGEFLGLAQSGFSSIEFDEQTIMQARRLIDDLKEFDKNAYYALMQKVLEKNERMRENIVLN